jgi:hypothetical protein
MLSYPPSHKSGPVLKVFLQFSFFLKSAGFRLGWPDLSFVHRNLVMIPKVIFSFPIRLQKYLHLLFCLLCIMCVTLNRWCCTKEAEGVVGVTCTAFCLRLKPDTSQKCDRISIVLPLAMTSVQSPLNPNILESEDYIP